MFVASSNYTKLFVIGGEGATYLVEVVDLSGEFKTCDSISNYPVEYGSVGTFLASEGYVLVCGGFSTNECYFYNTTLDIWVQTASMAHVRESAAATLLTPTQWWITGGTSSAITTEVYTSFQGLANFVNLPAPRTLHNIINIDEKNVMLLGNVEATNEVFMFDLTTNLWTELPPLLQARDQVQAGLVTKSDGQKEIIVAGGQLPSSSDSFIFNLETQEWREGPNLPYPLYSAASVPYGDTVLFVGGARGDFTNLTSTMMKYDQENEAFVILDEKMANARMLFSAFFVPDNYVNCN